MDDESGIFDKKTGLFDKEFARQVRWQIATNPDDSVRRPVALQSLNTRMRLYRLEMREFLLGNMLLIAAVCAVVMFGASYGLFWLSQRINPGAEPTGTPWWMVGLVLWLTSLIVPFIEMKPKRPTQEDIEADALRWKQLGVQADVESDD